MSKLKRLIVDELPADKTEKILAKWTLQDAEAWKVKVASAAQQLRMLLWEGYKNEVWELLGHKDWTACIKAIADEYGFSERHLWRLNAANKIKVQLALGSVENIPEKHLRPLTSLKPEQQKEVWQKAVETAPVGKVTASHVQTVVDRYKGKPEPDESRYEDGHQKDADRWINRLENLFTSFGLHLEKMQEVGGIDELTKTWKDEEISQYYEGLTKLQEQIETLKQAIYERLETVTI